MRSKCDSLDAKFRLNVFNENDVEESKEGLPISEYDDICNTPEGQYVPQNYSFQVEPEEIGVN